MHILKRIRFLACLVVFAASSGGLLAADFTVITTNCNNSWTVNGVNNNPTLTLIRGRTYTFLIASCSQHPFSIGYSVFGAVPPGVTGQGTSSGTVTYVVPTNAVNCVYYCTQHGFSGQIVMVDPPVVTASFTGSPTNGLRPLTVAFTNLSSNATTYSWDFGDGKSSTASSPANTYTNSGSYTVKLTARGANGTNILTRTSYIVVTNPPAVVSSFTGGPTNGVAPMKVAFTNLSSGAASYAWDFGNGNTSTATNPTNTYASAGTNTVKLTAIGAGGTNVFTRTNYVVVTNALPVLASFTGGPTNGMAPLTVLFTNLTSNAVSYTWDFGNGNISSAVSPTNSYVGAGTNTVKLTAIGLGGTNVFTRTNYIVVTNPPSVLAAFSGSPLVGVAPLSVTFTNQSGNATNYSWNFGDGNTSTVTNPVNIYTNAGSYTVKLTAFGASGSNILTLANYIVATNPVPVANFTGSPTNGVIPLTVTFANSSSNATSYLWDFGDGNTSVATNPVNIFTNAGTYSVKLTAFGVGGTNSLTLATYIVATNPAPVANFTGSPLFGAMPLTVVFTNLCSTATNYAWDFGDGNMSTAANVANTYTNAGSYTVMLTAIGPGGTQSLTRANYILVSNPPPPVIQYQVLTIPPALYGPTFNLWLSETNKRFWGTNPAPLPIFENGAATTTYGYNGMQFWGPTLIMSNSDFVHINLTNNLIDSTTAHWHGFHIPAIMDGGPHQFVPAGTVWQPSFKIINNAATYWYHPHLHTTTQRQLTYGAGGFIIVQDAVESALPLPRTYGVDDIPLALTSRRFLTNSFAGITPGNQLAQDHFLDNYGDYALVNGTYLPQVALPQQYVRLRILNAEIMRGYNLGFSDNRTFYVIANDQGMLDAPVPVTRVKLMIGERVEVLVNLGGDAIGSTLDLEAYNSGQEFGFPGNEGNPVTPTGVSGPIKASLLNNTDFNLLHMVVTNATASAIATLPSTLVTNTYWTTNDVTNVRNISLTGGDLGGEYTFNNVAYSPTFLNHTINLNAVEQWNITGSTIFGHAIHIHDIKFKVVSRSGGTQVSSDGLPAPYESGWKDTVYVPINENVSVIAKYDDFASNLNPFMFHCHFLNHEDGGMMGQFVVVNNDVEDLAISSFTRNGPNGNIAMNFKSTVGTTYTLQYSPDLTIGSWIDIASVTSDGSAVSYTDTDAARLALPRGFYRVTIPVITQ